MSTIRTAKDSLLIHRWQALQQACLRVEPLGVPGATPEEVALFSYGETDGGLWLAFHREEEYKKGIALSSQDNRLIDITRHEIDAAIKGTNLAATDRITFRSLQAGTRVVPLDLYGPTTRQQSSGWRRKRFELCRGIKGRRFGFRRSWQSRSKRDKHTRSRCNMGATTHW